MRQAMIVNCSYGICLAIRKEVLLREVRDLV